MRKGWLHGHFGATEKKTAEARRDSSPLNNHRRVNQVLMTGPKQRLAVLLTASVGTEESEPFAGACCALPAERAEHKALGFTCIDGEKQVPSDFFSFSFKNPPFSIPFT